MDPLVPPNPPVGLYVHVPFCDGKCRYCGFYSVPYDAALADRYLGALERELARRQEEYSPGPMETVYVGGGTPSLLDPAQLIRLCKLVTKHVRLAGGAEWTVECNPGTLDIGKARLLAEQGVNRISIGAQSFDDRVLRFLGRRHVTADTRAAVQSVRTAGITNYGVDLIACIPGVGARDWHQTLQKAMDLAPTHVSVYALTAEEGSALVRMVADRTVALKDDAEQLDGLDVAASLLEGRGYRRYEISNYALNGHECRHNQACWRGQGYLGVGPSASSHVNDLRWTNDHDLLQYIEDVESGGEPSRSVERLTPQTKCAELLVFGIRMNEGVDARSALARCGVQESEWGCSVNKRLQALGEDGLVVQKDGRWSLTPRGRGLADHVGRELLP